MSRLARFTQKLFGSTAGIDQIAEFGSLAASTPATYSGSTITPAIIQALGNYLEGWFGATLGENSQTIEDLNALCYLFSYQLAEIFQAGIAEWDAGTTYYIGSLVQSGSGVIYNSLTNTNLNNAITDGTHWGAPLFPGAAIPNTLPYAAGFTAQANESLMWPNLAIGTSQTVVVPSTASLIGITKIVVSGTGLLQATGTGTIRVI